MKESRKQARAEIFKEKEKFHKDLAKLPFEEKIEIMKRLQKLAQDIRKSTGNRVGSP